MVAKNLQQGEAAAAPVPANASNHGHLPIKGADRSGQRHERVVAKNLQQGEAAAAPVPANASNHG
ncbi:hypothetical protein CQA81_31745, partial [Klebsiella pneumoniae]